MSLKFVMYGALVLSLLMGGCEAKSNARASESRGSVAHAPSEAVPGSHEDWCGEHQVPESQCTRCNAALIPAFKASGDWCAEHHLPESQCLACNPDLKITRPEKQL
ncbi:MAG: hypothetical protein AB7K71_29190 [Polyangiaceae bacterium]